MHGLMWRTSKLTGHVSIALYIHATFLLPTLLRLFVSCYVNALNVQHCNLIASYTAIHHSHLYGVGEMKICAILAGASLLFVPDAFALTCTAPGHDQCTIACPGGCIAYYVEPNGPCRTMCSNPEITPSQVGVSISASRLASEQLQKLLSSPEMIEEKN